MGGSLKINVPVGSNAGKAILALAREIGVEKRAAHVFVLGSPFVISNIEGRASLGGQDGAVIADLVMLMPVDGKEAAQDPVPMILTCPSCSARHIDEPPFDKKPHHTHACQSCGMVWRPALVPTVGVRFLPGFKNEGTSP
jgi:hypothetical protein